MYEPTKHDWKLFQERLPEWQEAYMERLVKKYAEYLLSDAPASTKFWELDSRIKADKKTPGVQLTLSKSDMFYDICQLLIDGAITLNQLADFSEELQTAIRERIECITTGGLAK